MQVALVEFHRVLNSQGFYEITCPDIQSACALVTQDKLSDPSYISPTGPIARSDILFRHRQSLAQGNLFMTHSTCFTEKTLRATLQKAGFMPVATMKRPNFLIFGSLPANLPLLKPKYNNQ
jgi:hypothetical protein